MNFSLPRDLVDKLYSFVERNEYSNRSEIARKAIDEYLRKHDTQSKTKESK